MRFFRLEEEASICKLRVSRSELGPGFKVWNGPICLFCTMKAPEAAAFMHGWKMAKEDTAITQSNQLQEALYRLSERLQAKV